MYHFLFETAFIEWLEKPPYLALAKEAEFKRKGKKTLICSILFNKQYFGVPFVTCYLLNSVNQHADLIHNSVTVLSCTSKHFKWEEAPAYRYCLSSSISKSLWAGSVQAKPSSKWKSTGSGRQKTNLTAFRLEGQPVMEGSVGVRVGTRSRVGYQALAHLLGLGHERAGCQDYRSRQGRFKQGLLDLKLLVGLGRLVNPEGHGALEVHNALKLSLSSHSVGLCNQVFDLIALPLSLHIFMDQHRSLVRNWLMRHDYRYNL